MSSCRPALRKIGGLVGVAGRTFKQSRASADPVARVPGGALVDGAVTVTLGVLSHVRRDVEVSLSFDEAFGVVGLVLAERHPLASARDVAQHLHGHITFGHPIRGGLITP